MEIFGILFFILMLQPVISKKLLQSTRVKLLQKIEKERDARIVTLIHRQEAMNFLGFPIMRAINMEDAEQILYFLETTEPDVDIELVLHTPGGLVLAATQIAKAISRRKGKTRVIIPHYAMSGGTLIALAADEIIMSPNAVLGPVDPQLGYYPAPSLIKLAKQKKPTEISDEMLINIDIAEKALTQLQNCIIELLSVKYSNEKAIKLANILTQGTWTHDYPITPSYAKAIGLPVSDELPKSYMRLMMLYSQPVQQQSSVQYLNRDFGKQLDFLN